MEVSQSVLGIALVGLLVLGTAGAATVVGIPFGLFDSSAGSEPCVLNGSVWQSDEPLLDDDCDDLANITEVERGLDPQDPDTDSDGLDDYAEARLTSTDPLKPDSDGNGVLDGAEDPDGDGLTNAEEIEAGAAHDLTDGDGDGLTDPQEIENNTEPLRADTDDDGLNDGAEFEVGTDPLKPDSDGDGILDGKEIYTTVTADEALGVEIDITGAGAVADDISAGQSTLPVTDDSPIERARATPLVDIRWDRPVAPDQSFQSANVTFHYEDDAAPNESTLAVARYGRGLQTLVFLNTTLNRETNVATAQIDELGTYAVVDFREFQRFFGRN